MSGLASSAFEFGGLRVAPQRSSDLSDAAAGQAVAHCHVHLVPRTRGDLPENDLVYGMIDGWTPGGDAAPAVTLDVPPDEARAPRTADDMAAEADASRLPPAMAEPVFYVSASGLTRAIVNLKPLVPGHVLVVPAKNVP
ncbi:bis(5'-adenosyl)-triphosphatase [Aureococcus anophagefferens]|nr:bis(5'-adenosyl)-triphosphatase [Aureococcus anophagefferens]